MRGLNKFDWLLVLPVFLITSLGLLVIFSLDLKLFNNQLFSFFLGLLLYLFLSNFDYSIFKKIPLLTFFFSLFLLLITFILGKVTRGAIRWIQIGSFSFQASEFVKPLLILTFASFASEFDFYQIKNIFIFLVLLIFPDFLIFKQPDLGNSLVILIIWLGILLGTKIKKSYLLGGGLVLLFIFPLMWNFLKPYQKERMISFVNPSYDPLGSGYHLFQSKITVGSGELLGLGLGRGSQSQLRFLPERQTDFIFASFAEEFGFIGATLILLAYFVLLSRILFLAKRALDNFGFLICLGVFSMLFCQILVNIGMNVGIIPVTGITLPLFSSGGSSVVTTLISLGLVQNVAFSSKREEVIEIK